MKASVLGVGVALLLCTSVLAVPSVSLDGSLYIYTTGHNTSGGQNYANIAKLPWTGGTAGALNGSFFNTLNHNYDSIPFGYSNFDLYDHNLYLDVMEGTNSPRYPTVWKVDGATGAGTSVFVAASGQPGYNRSMAVDRATGDIYFASSGDTRATRLHDGNSDGDYKDAGEMTALSQPVSLWAGGGSHYQDAEFYNGWMYFTTGATRTPGYFVSRLHALPSDDCSVALQRLSFPGFPSVGDPWSDGPSYLAAGDPNKNGKVEIYAHLGASGDPVASGFIGHWEDADGDGVMTAAEMIDKFSVGSSARDLELVTDGTHWMLLYINSSAQVRYINLTDNGMLAAETGTLFTTGLAPSNSDFIHLKMDQTLAAIPEPATMTLLAAGAGAGLLGRARRRRVGRPR